MAGERKLEGLAEWADERVLTAAYVAISVNVRKVRSRLRKQDRKFLDPFNPERPSMITVDETAEFVIEQASVQMGIRGGLASLAGALSVPPEVLSTVASLIRLSQTLTIVYGYDPMTDRGQMVMWRALSAGLDAELPESGPMNMRIRDLLRMFSVPKTDQVGAVVTRALVRKSAWMVLRKFTRLVPVISIGSSTVGGRRKMRQAGLRMRSVLKKLAEAGPVDSLPILEAVEVST